MRVTFAAVITCTALVQSACQSPQAQAAVRREVNLEYVESLARDLAESNYDEKAGRVPEFLQDLDYDAYRDIRFDPLKALWAEEGLPFRVEFFHPGQIFNRSVRINEFTETHEQEIPFNSSFYNYGRNQDLPGRLPTSLGYAGLRIRYPINKVDVWDEVAVFLGGSYFRVIGRGQVYGLSARALAIDTAGDTPEEFPRFREFWLGKPAPGATSLTLFALLDSKSVAGAYKFIITPGQSTKVDVEATLYFRTIPERIGLTPFSSMFAWGENSLQKPVDFRPEVHDSDGLLMRLSDDSIVWRPLVNPPSTRLSVFAADMPKGFGLMQRDRDFEHYQDIEAAYHLRPSAWVDPAGMPRGKVTLFEFNTPDETVDNVVLLYEPETAPEVKQPFHYSYTLYFGDNGHGGDIGHAIATRIGKQFNNPGIYEVIVDFDSKVLQELPEVEPVKPDVTVNGGGTLQNVTVTKNRFNNTWRLILYIQPTDETPVEMSARLIGTDDAPLTETWSYQWTR